jgi:hypothetical protein
LALFLQLAFVGGKQNEVVVDVRTIRIPKRLVEPLRFFLELRYIELQGQLVKYAAWLGQAVSKALGFCIVNY